MRFLTLCLTILVLLAQPNLCPADSSAKAPDFNGAVSWLNVDKPLHISDLKGKVVLLDFWTYCCINCMHVIPDLEKLEAEFGPKLAVIGVHSAKFLNEKDTNNIRQAILRYQIAHPVINDSNFAVWHAYSAQGWPTFVLIDPDGEIVYRTSGEGHYADLQSRIAELISKNSGKLNETPLKLSLEKDKVKSSFLSFPGKIIADQEKKLLYVSDSNHNRILALNSSGETQFTLGSGVSGAKDGDFGTAEFKHPQGLALKGRKLFIADTENHLIREADLEKRSVRTILGTGQQSYDRFGGASFTSQAISSPWDLALSGDYLFIAMAGLHQIWIMDLNSGKASRFCGTGAENISDGACSEASFAQPSGISIDSEQLYVADSEVSAVRKIDLKTQRVETLIGRGLFGFGDKDGGFKEALLQHPLGVLAAKDSLFIADTYNHKIKQLSLGEKQIKTLGGSASAGLLDGGFDQAQFFEPSGLARIDDKLYVADTNNNKIRVLDLASAQVSSLEVKPQIEASEPKENSSIFLPNEEKIVLAPFSVIPGEKLDVNLGLSFAKGLHLNPEAPSQISLSVSDKKGAATPIKSESTTLALDLPSESKASELNAQAIVYYCTLEGAKVCYVKGLNFSVPLIWDHKNSANQLKLDFELKPLT